MIGRFTGIYTCSLTMKIRTCDCGGIETKNSEISVIQLSTAEVDYDVLWHMFTLPSPRFSELQFLWKMFGIMSIIGKN